MSNSSTAPAVAGHFQFRLATLLIAMAWVGLICLAVRTPTIFWSVVVAFLTLLTVLLAVLVAIYRIGRTRAAAVGFLVLCLGYIAYLTMLEGSLGGGLKSYSTPSGASFHALFLAIHPDREATITDEFGTPKRVPLPRDYDLYVFISICNQALASLFGITGAVIAQILYATRRDEPSPSRPPLA